MQKYADLGSGIQRPKDAKTLGGSPVRYMISNIVCRYIATFEKTIKKKLLKNIDIDMVIFENIDIDKAFLKNIDIDQGSRKKTVFLRSG